MFSGIEVTLVDVLMGGGLGIMFLVLFPSYLHERKERREAKDATAAWIRLSDEQYESAQLLRADLEEAEGALELACEDLANAEEEIEELEAESDDLEESANEAVAGWQAAVDLSTRVIAWAERVLDVAEERTPR